MSWVIKSVLRKFLKGKKDKKVARRIKDSERMKDLVELAKRFKNDQTETGKLARKILTGYRSLVRSEKKLEAAEKEYKKLKMTKGGEKDGRREEAEKAQGHRKRLQAEMERPQNRGTG